MYMPTCPCRHHILWMGYYSRVSQEHTTHFRPHTCLTAPLRPLTCTSTWLGEIRGNGSEEKCPRNKVCGGASMLASRPGRTNLWETLRSMGFSPRGGSDTVGAGLTFTAETETPRTDG